MNRYIALKDQGTASVSAPSLAAAWALLPDADDIMELTDTPRVTLGAWQGYDSLEDVR